MHYFDQSWPHIIASLFLRSYTQFFRSIKFQHLFNHLESICETEILVRYFLCRKLRCGRSRSVFAKWFKSWFLLDMPCTLISYYSLLHSFKIWILLHIFLLIQNSTNIEANNKLKLMCKVVFALSNYQILCGFLWMPSCQFWY